MFANVYFDGIVSSAEIMIITAVKELHVK